MRVQRLRRAGQTRCSVPAAISAATLAVSVTFSIVNGWPARADGASVRGVPPKDSFTGHISGAAGRYKHDVGSASIYLHLRTSEQAIRPVTVTIQGRACGHSRVCLNLRGRLKGTLTLTARPHVPDTGNSFSLKAVGAVTPLGHAAATGMGQGTGFIPRGRETMRLTFSTGHGSVTLSALSPPVPGFTSP